VVPRENIVFRPFYRDEGLFLLYKNIMRRNYNAKGIFNNKRII
jgi:hypothetical protein